MSLHEPSTSSAEVFAFPASSAQQRLWFLDQLEPGTAVYNIPQAFRLRGPLDVRVLQRAFREVVARHESLRTVFSSDEGQPKQVVHERFEPPFTVLDLRELPEAEGLARATALVDEIATAPFDLAKGPLLTTCVCVLGAEDHVFALNVHHIVCDGWSLALLFGELSRLYAAFSTGQASPLLPQEIQYADYAIWQHEFFQGEALTQELEFWKGYLAGELPQLTLPSDRSRPAKASLQGKLVRFSLSSAETEAVRELAKRERASLFMTLLSVFQTFLHRVTGETDILVGSPIANRDREEVAEAIGFYTNTVVFRNQLSAAETFRDVLAHARDRVLSALAHQEVPLERVVEAIHPDRSAGENPVFQVMFAMQKAPDAALSLPSVQVTSLATHSGTSKFDLLLEMQELAAGMQCFFEYSTDLFDDATAERLVTHFQELLRSLVLHPELPIGDAALLTPAEERRILSEWNATAEPYDQALGLHGLFMAEARRTPERIAVEAGSDRLTYRELDVRSTQLAHHLRSLGAATDSKVGVFLERSADMVVALLGILKAGAAYLPLDPSFPKDRLDYMLADAHAKLLVSTKSLESDLPTSDAALVWLDADSAKIDAHPSEAPDEASTAGPALAYTIYTSGSTGKPKGVEIPHRAAVNFLTSMAKAPGLTSDDRLLAVTTLSFDISVLEVFLPLSVGATCIVVPRDIASDGPALCELIDKSQATVMQATPATWLMLLEAGWQRGSLRKALCGGEAWPAGLAAELLSRVDQVFNMYGPTETTVWSTMSQVTNPDDILIGRPIANTRAFVLDPRLHPVPIGVAGELHIGGDGVARGYHELPELTGERFIQNPLDEGRLYKTGDLARYRPDGAIEYLGRLDNQVKVRGYRIELGEIETALSKHPAIKQAAVILWSASAADKRLAAYIVYEPGQTLTASELRKFLRTDLPDYMIPHFFVEMPSLPRTANGKLHRKALPDPVKQGADDALAFVEPRTSNEKLVAEIWQRILSAPKVGLHDNFFDLGGHSLLSAQVTFAIEKATGFRVSPRAMVFQNLGQVAALLPAAASQGPVGAAHTPEEPDELPLAPDPKEAPAPRPPAVAGSDSLFDKLRRRVLG